MKIVLTVMRDGQTRTYSLDRELVTLGRSQGCSIAIDDAALSRTHCQLERVDNQIFLRDLNSRNGTYLQGRLTMRAALQPGDVFEVGNVQVRFDGLEKPRSRPSLAFLTVPILAGRRRAKDELQELKEENKRLRRVIELIRSLVEELNGEQLLFAIMDAAVELVSAERGFLLVFRGQDFTVEVARNYWRTDVTEPELEISRSIADRVRRERQALLVEDAGDDPSLQAFMSVHALKLRSVLCVPLIHGDDVRGVIYLDNRFTRGVFQESDRMIMGAFCDLAAIALENSGRFMKERRKAEQLTMKVKERSEELERVRRVLELNGQRPPLQHPYEGLVAESEAMRDVLSELDRLTNTELPIIFEGETGVGKETLARIIHRNGRRHQAAFMPVACAALPLALAEVELFGHGAGAYTGSGGARGGLIDEASGGTLYLDGLEDLEFGVQAMLLRVLEDGEYRRVGEARMRKADVRVMASARLPVTKLIQDERLRPDLLYRLRGALVTLPPLRERPEDLSVLLDQILKRDAPGLVLSPEARNALLRRPWAGNIRELANEIRRVSALATDVIGLSDLGPQELPQDMSLKDAVADLERRMILRVLDARNWNVSQTARELGLSRLGLRNKMDRLGLKR